MYSRIEDIYRGYTQPNSVHSQRVEIQENYQIPNQPQQVSTFSENAPVKGVVYLPRKPPAKPAVALPVEPYDIPITPKGDNKTNPHAKPWAGPYWYYYHKMSATYPVNPTQYIQNAMKTRLMLIPYELPCMICRTHSIAFLDSKKEQIPVIVSSRKNLFNFFVDFHNAVSARLGKEQWSYKKAREVYGYSDDHSS